MKEMPTINPLSTVPQDLRHEIEQAYGSVPSFALAMPPAGLRLWWTSVRDFQLSEKTSLPRKTKELIGLGLAAQIPCEYSVLLHTEGARVAGATEQEIQEAVFMASLTRQSSGLLNGAQVETTTFEKELADIASHMKVQAAKNPVPAVVRR